MENASRLFPEHTLVRPNEHLPGGHFVDLHLKDKEARDVFIEVKSGKIGKEALGQILDYYSAILNYNSKKKPDDVKLILIGEELDPTVEYYLNRLDIKFLSLNQIGFFYEKFYSMLRERLSRTLTPTEAKMVSEWQAAGQKSVTIKMIAEKVGGNRNYASKLARRLEKKRWLSKISSGVYGFMPASYGYEERFPSTNPFLIGSVLVEPYYFAYSTANSRYGFTTQMPSTYYIATSKKRPAYQWRNIRFQFVTLSPRKFFGFRQEEIFGVKVNIADLEKTLVDAVDKMQYCGGSEEVVTVIQRGLKQADEPKLLDYIIRMDSYSLNQRFGFIIDFLYEHKLISNSLALLRKQLQQKIGKAPVYLEARSPKHGTYIPEWNLVQNVSERQLLTEVR